MAQIAFGFDDLRMPPRKGGKPPSRPHRPHFIFAWRKFRGLTFEKLAAKTGISVSQLQAIEASRSGYSRDSLEAIADALDCTPGDLLSRPPPGRGGPPDVLSTLSADELARVVDVVKLLRTSR